MAKAWLLQILAMIHVALTIIHIVLTYIVIAFPPGGGLEMGRIIAGMLFGIVGVDVPGIDPPLFFCVAVVIIELALPILFLIGASKNQIAYKRLQEQRNSTEKEPLHDEKRTDTHPTNRAQHP